MSAIEKHNPNTATVPASLDEQMRYARAVSDAGLAPDSFRRQPANVLIAIDIARSLDESTWTVMSEMSVIGGRPSFSAKFMRSRVRQAGHRLRESFTDGVARCVIIRADDPDFEHVAEWDEAKARQHGLWDKGHWRKNPELMLKNRAVSECIREACYEVMGGVAYTPDEVMDFHEDRGAVQARSSRTPAQGSRSNHDKAAAALGMGDDTPAATIDTMLAEVEQADGDKDALRALWQRAAALPDEDRDAVRAVIQATAAPTADDAVDAEVVEGDAA